MNDGGGFWQDCTGPSSYKKAQGIPVKIWGLLAEGTLHIRILPDKQNMNRWWYAWMVEHDFPRWLGSCKYSGFYRWVYLSNHYGSEANNLVDAGRCMQHCACSGNDLLVHTCHYQGWCSDLLGPAPFVTQAHCWIHVRVEAKR